jgi:hypothetical protein
VQKHMPALLPAVSLRAMSVSCLHDKAGATNMLLLTAPGSLLLSLRGKSAAQFSCLAWYSTAQLRRDVLYPHVVRAAKHSLLCCACCALLLLLLPPQQVSKKHALACF